MRVGVFINTNAGKANPETLRKKVSEALHRCALEFYFPLTRLEMQEQIAQCLESQVEYLIICGGDGTLNTSLQVIMNFQQKGKKIPPILNIPVGTANDLASEVGISKLVDKAARIIFQETHRLVDVLEIESHGSVKYMITNGGLGVPAQTAERANILKQWVKDQGKKEMLPPLMKDAVKGLSKVVEKFGSRIYEILVISDILRWNKSSWRVDINVPGKTSFTTEAPFVLINNQPSVGGNFKPAPLTSNSDGTFNVLLIEPKKLLPQVKSILDIRMGKIPDFNYCPSFEVEEIRLKAVGEKKLTFFGDGEILFEKVSEIKIRCIHPGIPIVVEKRLA